MILIRLILLSLCCSNYSRFTPSRIQGNDLLHQSRELLLHLNQQSSLPEFIIFNESDLLSHSFLFDRQNSLLSKDQFIGLLKSDSVEPQSMNMEFLSLLKDCKKLADFVLSSTNGIKDSESMEIHSSDLANQIKNMNKKSRNRLFTLKPIDFKRINSNKETQNHPSHKGIQLVKRNDGTTSISFMSITSTLEFVTVSESTNDMTSSITSLDGITVQSQTANSESLYFQSTSTITSLDFSTSSMQVSSSFIQTTSMEDISSTLALLITTLSTDQVNQTPQFTSTHVSMIETLIITSSSIGYLNSLYSLFP